MLMGKRLIHFSVTCSKCGINSAVGMVSRPKFRERMASLGWGFELDNPKDWICPDCLEDLTPEPDIE